MPIIPHEQIAQRAYEIYQRQGGTDFENWIQAEAELRQELKIFITHELVAKTPSSRPDQTIAAEAMTAPQEPSRDNLPIKQALPTRRSCRARKITV